MYAKSGDKKDAHRVFDAMLLKILFFQAFLSVGNSLVNTYSKLW